MLIEESKHLQRPAKNVVQLFDSLFPTVATLLCVV